MAPPEEPVDPAFDELYAGDLDQFVARRDQLAKDLRGSGDREAGAKAKQLRKPSRAAWAVNQAVRRAPELFDEVVRAGAALRNVQQRALSEGSGAGLHDAMRARQRAVGALADVGVEALGPTGASARDAIEQTLNAASIDDNAAAAVREARLTQELEPPDIFSTLDAGPGGPPAPVRSRRETEATPRPTTAKPPRAKDAKEEPWRADRRERQQAERTERAAAAAIEARREADEARQAHEQAEARADELAQQAREAADAAEKARRAVRHTATAARDARRRAERAEREALAARPATGADG